MPFFAVTIGTSVVVIAALLILSAIGTGLILRRERNDRQATRQKWRSAQTQAKATSTMTDTEEDRGNR